MLRECVISAFSARTRPIEILVSDDGHEAAVIDTLAALEPPDGITIRYIANHAGSGQSTNVNNLFEHAAHERLILIHDDDFFLDRGIDLLVAEWDARSGQVDSVYGRQCIAKADGTIDWRATAGNDRSYFKHEPAGIQRSPLWAALAQQFPNNSMILRRSIANAVRYPCETQVGYSPVDLAFNIAYAKQCSRSFVMLHDYVAAYRRSDVSVLRDRKTRRVPDGHLFYNFIQTVQPSDDDEWTAHALLLDRFAAPAILGYIAAGKAQLALSVLRSHYRNMNVSRTGRLRLIALTFGALAGVSVLKAEP